MAIEDSKGKRKTQSDDADGTKSDGSSEGVGGSEKHRRSRKSSSQKPRKQSELQQIEGEQFRPRKKKGSSHAAGTSDGGPGMSATKKHSKSPSGIPGVPGILKQTSSAEQLDKADDPTPSRLSEDSLKKVEDFNKLFGGDEPSTSDVNLPDVPDSKDKTNRKSKANRASTLNDPPNDTLTESDAAKSDAFDETEHSTSVNPEVHPDIPPKDRYTVSNPAYSYDEQPGIENEDYNIPDEQGAQTNHPGVLLETTNGDTDCQKTEQRTDEYFSHQHEQTVDYPPNSASNYIAVNHLNPERPFSQPARYDPPCNHTEYLREVRDPCNPCPGQHIPHRESRSPNNNCKDNVRNPCNPCPGQYAPQRNEQRGCNSPQTRTKPCPSPRLGQLSQKSNSGYLREASARRQPPQNRQQNIRSPCSPCPGQHTPKPGRQCPTPCSGCNTPHNRTKPCPSPCPAPDRQCPTPCSGCNTPQNRTKPCPSPCPAPDRQCPTPCSGSNTPQNRTKPCSSPCPAPDRQCPTPRSGCNTPQNRTKPCPSPCPAPDRQCPTPCSGCNTPQNRTKPCPSPCSASGRQCPTSCSGCNTPQNRTKSCPSPNVKEQLSDPRSLEYVRYVLWGEVPGHCPGGNQILKPNLPPPGSGSHLAKARLAKEKNPEIKGIRPHHFVPEKHIIVRQNYCSKVEQPGSTLVSAVDVRPMESQRSIAPGDAMKEMESEQIAHALKSVKTSATVTPGRKTPHAKTPQITDSASRLGRDIGDAEKLNSAHSLKVTKSSRSMLWSQAQAIPTKGDMGTGMGNLSRANTPAKKLCFNDRKR